jgi:hypothetical protein
MTAVQQQYNKLQATTKLIQETTSHSRLQQQQNWCLLDSSQSVGGFWKLQLGNPRSWCMSFNTPPQDGA